jgi:hypothetical protein
MAIPVMEFEVQGYKVMFEKVYLVIMGPNFESSPSLHFNIYKIIL